MLNPISYETRASSATSPPQKKSPHCRLSVSRIFSIPEAHPRKHRARGGGHPTITGQIWHLHYWSIVTFFCFSYRTMIKGDYSIISQLKKESKLLISCVFVCFFPIKARMCLFWMGVIFGLGCSAASYEYAFKSVGCWSNRVTLGTWAKPLTSGVPDSLWQCAEEIEMQVFFFQCPLSRSSSFTSFAYIYGCDFPPHTTRVGWCCTLCDAG